MLGMKVLLDRLVGDNKTDEAVKRALNRPFTSVELRGDSEIVFKFEDGELVLTDEGQSCRENRYMVCDDDLSSFAGASIVDIEIRDAPETESEYGSHEVQFLAVKTTKGEIVCSNHNEHNGYYCGFCVVARFNGS